MLEYPREEVRANTHQLQRGAMGRGCLNLHALLCARAGDIAHSIPNDRRIRAFCLQAIALLERNLSEAKKTLKELIEDQGLLRDQITTTEVNMARVFNWDVKERRKLKKEEES